ncbi:MAG: PEP-CTERM system histidine kinase PrsK [Betaproteobacteria bacterium]|nr:PEP-CTERM system histidine kinase PrsK [Betaproteobacteria bacterium]
MTPNYLASICYGGGLLAFLALAALLAVRAKGNQRARLLAGACAAAGIWELTGIFAAVWPSEETVLAHVLSDALRFSAWFLFILHLQNSISIFGRNVTIVASMRWSVVIVVFMALSGTTIFAFFGTWAMTQEPIGNDAIFAAFAVSAVLGLTQVEQLYRGAEDTQKWALKPLCIGVAAMLAFDLFVFSDALLVKEMNSQVWAVRGLVHALTIPLLLIATHRNRQWTVDVAVSRRVVFGSTALLLSGLYMLAVAGAGYFVRIFGGSWATAAQATVIFVAMLGLAVLVFSGSIRARIRVLISKNFFSYRYDYREEWLKFTGFLSEPGRHGDIVTRSIHALADLVESPGGTQWWRTEDGAFVQVGRWNMPNDQRTILAGESLLVFLEKTGWVIDIADYGTRREAYPDLELPPWLTESRDVWIVIPLFAGTRLEGLVALLQPRTPIDLDWEVLDLLKTAAKQAASVLSQVRLAGALVEAQQFSAFNRMSAFVVHDLKNLVAQLSLMLKNAERHGANPEFQKDMRETIEHVVLRMQRLLMQLRSGADPVENASPVDLGAVIASIRDVWARHGRNVAVSLTSDCWVMGHAEKLERVLGHLVQNGFDAMDGSGSVKVSSRLVDRFIVLDVEDQGKGMTQEFIREELFKPFRSTKSTGMGIGAYESQQYVQEIGGRIAVDSREGEGTTFSVYLPARHRNEASRQSDSTVA